MTRAMGKATEDCFYPMIVARGKGRRNEGARVVAGTVDVLDVTLEREHARQNEAEHGRR